jgi:hypothetical protein
MKIPKEISIINYICQDNHYYFKIDVEYQGDFPPEKINKRYGEIRKLYKLLLLKYPGCLIPEIKSKTFAMKHIRITEEERQQLKSNAQKFLGDVINHPILNKTKTVLDFLSNNNSHMTNNSLIKKYLDEDDENESLSSSCALNENKSDNIISNKEKKINLDDFEIIEKDDYKEFFEDEEKDELLDMFLEEENYKNKGIISKSKDILMSTYKYLKKYSYDNDSQNYYQDKELNDNKVFSESNLQEKDFEFIKNNQKDLGENIEINNYEKEIMKFNEGIEYLIKNFEKEINISEKKNVALNNIINIYEKDSKQENKKDIKKDDKNKNNENDSENNIEKEKDNNDNNKDNHKDYIEKLDLKIFAGEINKIKSYTKINTEYISKDLRKTIEKIKDYKNTIEGLKNIFIRKKNHIQFLIKLHSQLNEIEKKNELTDENDKNKQKIEQDLDFFKKKVELEKNFINELNKHLKYEIENFKNTKENSIYSFIVNLYKNYYLKQSELAEIARNPKDIYIFKGRFFERRKLARIKFTEVYGV